MTPNRSIIVAARQVLEVKLSEHRAAAAQASALLVLSDATSTSTEGHPALAIVEKAHRDNAAAAATFHEKEVWRYEVAIGQVIMAEPNMLAAQRLKR